VPAHSDSAAGVALFDTPLGRCAIAWTSRGVAAVQLPEGRDTATRARAAARAPGAAEAVPPRDVQRAIDEITLLFSGQARALDGVKLDLEGVSPFARRVYEATRAVSPGSTTTYRELARRLGEPGKARAVGRALGHNPFAVVVPCHRVLGADGRLGGFSANGGVTTKQRLLILESLHAPREDGASPGDHELGFDAKAAVRRLRAADPTLARVIARAGPFALELRRASSVFAMLAEAIVYQQLTGRAAATIYARVCALFPGAHRGFTPQHILRASEARLRGAGLSRAKTLALKDLARRAARGELPGLAEARELDDAVLIERLTQVRGIGRWTVEMLLIFRLGRPDVLPVDDFGVRKGYAVAFGKRSLPKPRELARIGERWAPHRTVAAWYLWRAAAF
jgi:methylated-DNA-[protein]-cysteine S-methyltransferase